MSSRTNNIFVSQIVWTASSEFGTYRPCEQRRFRRACASAQSRQNLRCSLIQAVSRGTFRQKARSLAPLNGWACAVKICLDGMLEDTNSFDGARIMQKSYLVSWAGDHQIKFCSVSERCALFTEHLRLTDHSKNEA